MNRNTEQTPAQKETPRRIPRPAPRSRDAQRQASKEELRRQEQYLQRAARNTARLAGILGRTPTFHVQNFGCQMNARDAEKLAGILRAAGYEETPEESADFVIYNTCTVRDNADQHFYGRLGRAAHYRKRNPSMKIAVCGCLAQEPAAVEKLKKSYPYVDLIFGTHNLFCFPQYLCEVYEDAEGDFALKGRKVTEIWDATDEIVEELPVQRLYPYKSGVNIMFGCDNYCTYCIVPYVRGHERSREPMDILRECERLAADGVVEVMLLGQNVDTYGQDLDTDMTCTFAGLLEAVAGIDAIRRIRFMTPHPRDISEEVLRVMQENPKIARHIHFPLQSGSNRILKRMNRCYTREQFIEKALKIREMLPDAAITTDIITGFPGETPSDVDDTIDVIRRVHFDNAYTFIYSPRRGTPAASWEQLPREQVQEQFDRVLAEVQNQAREQAARRTGQTLCALAEEVNTQLPGYVTCRLSNNLIVHVRGGPTMIGHFYDVHLDECRNFYYYGTVVGENPRGW